MRKLMQTGRDIRAERNRYQPIVSQRELARAADLGRGTHLLSALERGRVQLDDNMRRRIEAAFDTIEKRRRELSSRA